MARLIFINGRLYKYETYIGNFVHQDIFLHLKNFFGVFVVFWCLFWAFFGFFGVLGFFWYVFGVFWRFSLACRYNITSHNGVQIKYFLLLSHRVLFHAKLSD